MLVNQESAPLVIQTAAANVLDHCQMMSTITAMPRVRGSRGRPKQPPDVLYTDRGYDSDETRALLRWLGIRHMIAGRGQQHGSGPARIRRVVERTIRWLKGMRRLRIRYDRQLVIQRVWNAFAAAIICYPLDL